MVNLYMDYVGKRSLRKKVREPVINRQPSQVEAKPLPVDPIPFDFATHGGRYRRQRNQNCQPDDTRYILFILDTSGSIGIANFEKMTDSLSKLVNRFCKRIKIAVMTFDHNHHIEFNFNCFDNTCAGRRETMDAMKSIRYRGGLTYTGEATLCACTSLLISDFGFPDLPTGSSGTRCLDVIYVTDGHSNGPIDVCHSPVMDCLHVMPDVDMNVFAIGIGNNYDVNELKCITNKDDFKHIFFETNFTTFSGSIDAVSNTPGTCVPDGHTDDILIGTDVCE